jgi:TRAP-type C4-dicarboxylate transport system permease small subunit
LSEVPVEAEGVDAAGVIAPPSSASLAGEIRTLPLNCLIFMRSFTRIADRVYLMMGWICGMELLLLGFFITYQVIARKVGWVQAPATDVMSGYILAMAATWSFSYSLRSGSHVRIDVMLPFMGWRMRRTADFIALASVAFLASITAWKMWIVILKNYDRGVVTNDYPLTPLWIPKIVVGLGFAFLGFTAIQMMLSMLAEWFLPMWHRNLGGGEIEIYDVMVDNPPSVA